MTEIKTTENQEEEFDKGVEFKMPIGIRIGFSIISGIILLLIVAVYFYLVLCKPNHIDPKQFGLPEIFTICIAILAIVNIPWHKLGFRIKKIGMIELEQIVKGQGRNNSNELADLQNQIDELKNSIKENDFNSSSGTYESELDELVLKFLSEHNRWAFSALRIKKWGCNQSGFEKLKSESITTQKIRQSLRRLLANDKVETRISKKGNTIYILK